MKYALLLSLAILTSIRTLIAQDHGAGSDTRAAIIQNITARIELNLDGRWNYLVDPYENGYYDYRHQPYDQSASGTGGFFDDKNKPTKASSSNTISIAARHSRSRATGTPRTTNSCITKVPSGTAASSN